MLKESKTKIQVGVWDVVATVLKRDLEFLQISRDKYLNTLLKDEIEKLEIEVADVTPRAACKHIKARLGELKRQRLTIAIDKDVSQRIDEVLARKNILRDAFINRVLFFLVAQPEHLKKLKINCDQGDQMDHREAQPLSEVRVRLYDPFAKIRLGNTGMFYSIALPDRPVGKLFPNLFGLNCAITADEWNRINVPAPILLYELGLPMVRRIKDSIAPH